MTIFKKNGNTKWSKWGMRLLRHHKSSDKSLFSFWLKASLATFFSWAARFCLINFLILAFTPVGDHLLIYAHQLIMWIVMIISPTPGGAVIAEFAFEGFLAEFTPLGLAGLLPVLWRLASYYPYLIIGLLILPKWLKKVYS